jgi:hypothetical protein
MRMPIVIAAVLAAFACLAPAQAGAAPSADAAAYCARGFPAELWKAIAPAH